MQFKNKDDIEKRFHAIPIIREIIATPPHTTMSNSSKGKFEEMVDGNGAAAAYLFVSMLNEVAIANINKNLFNVDSAFMVPFLVWRKRFDFRQPGTVVENTDNPFSSSVSRCMSESATKVEEDVLAIIGSTLCLKLWLIGTLYMLLNQSIGPDAASLKLVAALNVLS